MTSVNGKRKVLSEGKDQQDPSAKRAKTKIEPPINEKKKEEKTIPQSNHPDCIRGHVILVTPEGGTKKYLAEFRYGEALNKGGFEMCLKTYDELPARGLLTVDRTDDKWEMDGIVARLDSQGESLFDETAGHHIDVLLLASHDAIVNSSPETAILKFEVDKTRPVHENLPKTLATRCNCQKCRGIHRQLLTFKRLPGLRDAFVEN